MADITWYFDFISPYAYFGLQRLNELPADATVTLQPILFAGLLNHWGQKGPAEIPSKKLWTFRSCIWQAQQRGWPFRIPAAHPFNPLPYLRLSVAAGNSPAAVRAIFEQVWTTGADLADSSVVAKLARSLNVDQSRLADSDVKDAVRAATNRAIDIGVFGVPTIAIGDQIFWGSDAAEFATAYRADPSLFASDEMTRAATLPAGAERK